MILDQHEDKVTREEIAALSQYHFTIERVNTEKIFIEDHSSSGTYVNGSLIGKGNKGHLRSGDTITLGENIMVFKFFMFFSFCFFSSRASYGDSWILDFIN